MNENAIFLDTETTGLNNGLKSDELVELAIIDWQGKELLNTLVKPVNHSSWEEAQSIHGITPKMVQNAPTLQELASTIRSIVKGKDVVIYNANFDTSFFKNGELSEVNSISCCMEDFATYYGDWHEYFQNFTWKDLILASEYVRHVWTGESHRAEPDAQACRAVWFYLNDQQERERVEAIKADEQAELEAERFVDQVESRKYQELKEMGNKFFKTLCESLGIDNSYTDYKKREDVVFAFFGIKKSWFFYDNNREKLQGIKIYKEGDKIPNNLVSSVKDYKQNCMIKHGIIKPEAVHIFNNGKSVVWLYDIKKIKRQQKKTPLLLATEKLPPDMYHMTTLQRKLKVKKSVRDTLKIAGWKNSQYGGCYPFYKYVQK